MFLIRTCNQISLKYNAFTEVSHSLICHFVTIFIILLYLSIFVSFNLFQRCYLCLLFQKWSDRTLSKSFSRQCKSKTFKASYFNRLVKLWNYVPVVLKILPFVLLFAHFDTEMCVTSHVTELSNFVFDVCSCFVLCRNSWHYVALYCFIVF